MDPIQLRDTSTPIQLGDTSTPKDIPEDEIQKARSCIGFTIVLPSMEFNATEGPLPFSGTTVLRSSSEGPELYWIHEKYIFLELYISPIHLPSLELLYFPLLRKAFICTGFTGGNTSWNINTVVEYSSSYNSGPSSPLVRSTSCSSNGTFWCIGFMVTIHSWSPIHPNTTLNSHELRDINSLVRFFEDPLHLWDSWKELNQRIHYVEW